MKVFKISLLITSIFSIILASGCATQLKVMYPTTEVQTSSNSIFSGKTLVVKRFEDARGPVSKDGNRIVKKDGSNWYFNNDTYYDGKTACPSISQMIAKHLDATRMFSKVVYGEGDSPQYNYRIEGKVKVFEGYKEENTAAEVGSGFGLLGVLATSGVQSKFEAKTLLIEVKLIDNTSGKTIWEGEASGSIGGSDYADSGGWSAYEKASLSLKAAVDDLIGKLGRIN